MEFSGTIWHLIGALAVFLISHVIPSQPTLRQALIKALTRPGYLIAYSALSIAVLIWVGWAYGDAPYVELWPLAPWQIWVPVLVMPIACVLAVAGLSTANPFSLGPGDKGPGDKSYDPAHPGILRLTRHPAIWAFILWSGTHMVPNGDLASIILFGLLFGLSLAGLWLLDAKRRLSLGADWERLTINTSKGRISLGEIGWVRIAIGLAVYAGLLYGHTLLGPSPLPY